MPSPPTLHLKVEAALGQAPNTYPRAWTDWTPYLKGKYWKVSSRRGRSFVLDQIQAGRLSVTLDNSDGRFTPENNASPYYPNLGTDVPIRAHTTRTLVSDTFTRTTSPGLGTSDSGHAYTYGLQSSWSTNGSRAVMTTGIDNYAVVDAGVSDVDVQVTFVTAPKRARLLWRFVTMASCFVMEARPDLGRWDVYAGIGGASLLTIAQTPADGDVVRVALNGTSHTIYINNVRVGAYASSMNTTATKFGFGKLESFFDPGGVTFDDFSVVDFGPMFEGYIQSYDPEFPSDYAGGICTIEATDGLAPLNYESQLTGTTIYDSFDRPNQVGLGALDKGGTWTIVHKDNANPAVWEIIGNTARVSRDETLVPGYSQYLYSVAWVEGGAAAVNLRVDFKEIWQDFATSGPFLMFRYQDIDHFWGVMFTTVYSAAGFAVKLFRRELGVYANFPIVLQTIETGDWRYKTIIVTVRTSGDRIEVSLGGDLGPINFAPVLNSYLNTATKHGFGRWYSQNPFVGVGNPALDVSGTFDNFSIGFNLDPELSGARVGHLLDVIGWPSELRQLATGTVTAKGKYLDTLDPLATTSILQDIQQIAESELGLFFIRADGVAVFEDRLTRLDSAHTTSKGTFGNGGGSVIGCAVFRPRMDNTRLANIVTVTRELDDVNEVQTINIANATGGTFDVTRPEGSTYHNVAYNATVATMQTVMDALYGALNTDVTGADGGPWVIEFIGGLQAQNIDPIQVDGTNLTGTDASVSVLETTPGSSKDDKSDPIVLQDAASIALHWRRKANPVSVALTNDSDARMLAALLLNRWKDDHQRIDGLALDWADPAQYAKARKLDISDLINVQFAPRASTAYTIAQASFIEGVDHEISQDSQVTTLHLSPAALSASYWVLGDSAFGVLGSTTIAA